MVNSTIESRLAMIFLKRGQIDFNNEVHLRDEKLLGPKIGMRARDLLQVFFDVEREFGIRIPEDLIMDGYFDSYNHILSFLTLNK